ncbi:MAG TPA: formyltransferase family protein [Thermodesulfobacteriota bacterium]|nr:formyltransferase family protein [Thermodesulfobacteriota bacterium]
MGRIRLIYEPQAGPMSVAVFVSGSGTNFIALYEEQKRLEKSGAAGYGRVDAVFTNAPGCTGAEKAKEFGIPLLSLNSRSYFDALEKNPDDEEARDYYDAATISLVEEVCSPDLVVLAGYRRRLGRLFMKRYGDKIINLYPGDTTKPYLVRGIDASVQALRAGERSIKCTVFLQRESERFGPALVQSQPISLKGFTEKDTQGMQEKIRREGEWKIFPFAVHHLIAKGRISIDEEDNVYVDGEKMPREGYQFIK